MENASRLSKSEKKLLNVMGRHPALSLKELLNYTTYRVGTVMRKLERLKELGVLRGPAYDLNYSKLCRNPLHKLFCILESDQSFETVISYVKLIEPIRSIFPVMSPHKNVLVMVLFSSDDAKTTALLQLLKDNSIITDYIVRVWRSKRMVENPDLFGDPFPSLDHLLDPCEIPDLSLGCHDTVWDECEISIIPYVRFNDTGIIEILREEKKLHRTWTYEQIRYSRERMVKNGLIEKKYAIYPYPVAQCADLYLFLRTDHTALTQRILCNFARGGRIYKEYVLCEDFGWILCTSHPLFLTDMLYKLDQIGEIKEKEVYQLRSNPPKRYSFDQPIVLKYYDFETQTLEYPYHMYKEEIRKKLESEQLVYLK